MGYYTDMLVNRKGGENRYPFAVLTPAADDSDL